MNRYHHDPILNLKELRGHASWKDWHKGVLVYLDAMGLRYLLFPNLRALRGSEQLQYVADQRRAVQLLVSNMSEQVLQRLWRCGWETRSATLKNTLALLEDMLAEPERHPQQSYETHRDIVDLARGEFVTRGFRGAAADEYLRSAQQCHLRLLARYGGGNASVEELLEHLFTSSVMEGLKAARPDQHEQWMRELADGKRSTFVEHLVSLIRDPHLDNMAGRPEEPAPESDDERRMWDRRRAARNKAKKGPEAWGLPQSTPRRKRRRRANHARRRQQSNYPDYYPPLR